MFEVYWIGLDGKPLRKECPTKNAVVGWVKHLVDYNLSKPRNGIMIEIGVKDMRLNDPRYKT